MTTAAQRIWEAIYAAEFVRRMSRGDIEGYDDEGFARASDEAKALADWREELIDSKCIHPPASRFRRRSR